MPGRRRGGRGWGRFNQGGPRPVGRPGRVAKVQLGRLGRDGQEQTNTILHNKAVRYLMWIELVSNFEIVPTCCIFVYIVELKRKSHCIFCNRFFLWFSSSLLCKQMIGLQQSDEVKTKAKLYIVWTNMLHDIWLQKQKIKYKNWDIHFKTIKAYVCQVFLSRSSILPACSDVCSPWAACPLLSSCIPVMGGRGSPDPLVICPPPSVYTHLSPGF